MTKFLTNLDLSNNEIVNVLLQKLASDPSSPSSGRIYYNTTDNKIRFYNGTVWIELPGAGGGGDADTLEGEVGSYYLARVNHTGTQAASTISDLATVVKAYTLDEFADPAADINANNHKIVNLATPTNTNDAATLGYVNTQISALVDSAPGVLDTLNELAAALGDDPNFATTVATNIDAAKNRANHTGTQTVSTISDFNSAVASAIAARYFTQDIGDGGTTAIVVTHNLGTRDVQVSLRQSASPYSLSHYTDVEATSTNTITLRFAVAPTTNEYKVLITKVG